MSTPTRNPPSLNIPLLLFPQLQTTNPPLPTPIFPPPPPPPPPPHIASFKPTIAVIVAALTTMFSLTFLLLLYAKHCKRENGNTYSRNHRAASSSSSSRLPTLTSANKRNSGVDPTVIDLLPVFRFGALQGQKDGLECAVCLNRFESPEVLRLLPKCKHAFHVECVDTWLDAHSTCPLCRYRVDPEDILLVSDAIAGVLGRREPPPPPPQTQHPPADIESIQRLESSRRISGRHSSAGERGTGLLKIFLHRPSQDSASNRDRRSLDSWRKKNKKLPESVTVGCFDRQQRKDGLLLTEVESENDRRRLEHRIIIGGGGGKKESERQRWSEVQGSDLVLLRTEMIMNESRRWSSSSGSRASVVQTWKCNNNNGRREIIGIEENGNNVIKKRSVSELTGITREPTPVVPVRPVSKLLGWNWMSNSLS